MPETDANFAERWTGAQGDMKGFGCMLYLGGKADASEERPGDQDQSLWKESKGSLS
jgi:hypothetical protein